MITPEQLEEWRRHPFRVVTLDPVRDALLKQRQALAEELAKLRQATDVLLRIVQGTEETCPDFIGEHQECLVCGLNSNHSEDCPVPIYREYFKPTEAE